MVKAMYSGVAGLKAHQSRMDVIGNNIANVNTWGYKSMDTSFKESIYQTLSSGSSGSTNEGGYGGTNPSMIGYGSMVSAISADFTTGTQVPTGRGLDLFIDGTAFFAVGPMFGEGEAQGVNNLSLTRVGNFGNANGYLVDSNGRYVYGSSMTTGGTLYTPKGKSEQKRDENVTITGTSVPRDSKKTEKGVTTEINYEENLTPPGTMTVTTTTSETFDAADVLNIPKGSSLSEIKRALNEFNAGTAPGNVNTGGTTATGVYWKLDPADQTKIIKVQWDMGTDVPAVKNAADVLTGITGTSSAAAINEAIIAANAKVGETGVWYEIVAPTPPATVPTQVTEHKWTAKISTDSGSITELPGNIILPPTEADVAAAIVNANALPSNKADGIFYIQDPDNKMKVIKRVTSVNLQKNMPFPNGSTETKPDGTIVTISYEDNKKNNGTMTVVTTTTYPTPENVEKMGPEFDDGRMIFNSEEGSYTMAPNVDTLKPLKIPTSCTYYDENGEEYIEDNITFSNFSVDGNGLISATSTASGRSYILGAVALVNVPNPSGMNKQDGPYYQMGGSSGEPQIIQAGGKTGKLYSGYLESANVDIANEFSNMITTQRGFQANSKIITVTDEMLAELVNMKR